MRLKIVSFLLPLAIALLPASGAPLTVLDYRILGTQLQVSPTALSVPKSIAGSVMVQLSDANGATNSAGASLAAGAYVEATLRGPAFAAQRLVGQVNQALLLPPLSLVGDYQLDNIRLIDAATGQVRMEGAPSSVPVHVFDEVLVSRVTSRPLTTQEIQDRGIVIDEQNFRVVEFEVGFVLDGKLVPVKFPVVAPGFQQSTEIIPQAELDARLARAQAMNQQITLTTELPEELQRTHLNIDIQGINFQKVEDADQDLTLTVPPIPALMVIPGNIGYLHQFFSVQIFTENAAPANSGLSVFDLRATLNLPPGPDQIASTNYNQPGDDPLRFARLGPNRIVEPTQAVARPGPDGVVGTADDIGRLYPGDSGQGEFLVEGLQEGLHVMDLTLTAKLDGLAAGTIAITGKAAGSVLVRNPKFSLAFSHPRTVRAGEPYDAFATVLNTSASPANYVSISLSPASLSGGVLESDATVPLGTILPGQTATAKFHVRAQRTGAVSFSNLTTGDDSVQGRFRLSMGIDERGVALSPDTMGLPDYVQALPQDLLNAANRVLGQALSVATAAQLPPEVATVTRAAVTRRVLELAEAGQRVRYGDPLNRVLADLMLDWQGGRTASGGFDQILREADAGREYRLALARAMELADSLDAVQRLVERGPDLVGRSEAWVLAGASGGVEVEGPGAGGGGGGYRGARGNWLVSTPGTNQVLKWQITNALPRAELNLVVLRTNGSGQVFHWALANPPVNSCYTVNLDTSLSLLQADTNCDGFIDAILPADVTPITERAPQLVAALQDTTVDAGRPIPTCLAPDRRNYGTVMAVLFSKPMTQASVNLPAAYTLDNGNTANSVQIQPGGRVALLNLRMGISAIHPRQVLVSGIRDLRGNGISSGSLPVQTTLNQGVALHGRVARADGNPAGGIPVTLTMYDQQLDTFLSDCNPFVVRVSQVNTDTNGYFDFDYVMSGVEYSVSATDTTGLSSAAADLILQAAEADSLNRNRLLALANSSSAKNTLLQAFAAGTLSEAMVAAEGIDRALLRDKVPIGSAREGTTTPVALRFRGRGLVLGQVVEADGTTPVSGAAVNLFPDPDSREKGRGILADSQGRFAFGGVPLGVFTVQAQNSAGLARTIAGNLLQPGQVASLLVVLSSVVIPQSSLAGRIVEADGLTPHPGGRAYVGKYVGGIFGSIVAAVTSDASGAWVAGAIPASTYDVVAISVDGKRKGERLAVAAPVGVTNQVTLPLAGSAVVVGRVETVTGTPVTNALVAGGETLVRTDATGRFRLDGVPTGPRTISAGLERNPAAGVDFPRLGSAVVEVVAGIDNFVVVRLEPAGRVVGRILDAAGRPVPNVTVAMPMEDGFRWVVADGEGNYQFDNVSLGGWTVSAPGPGTSSADVSGALNTLKNSASEEELQTAIGQAYAVFTGVNDPYLNGSGASYNPLTWGFTKGNLAYDGQTAVADIRYLRQGTASGKVINGQGVPIGARVRLTGIGPLANGMPSIILRGERNTDPALGTFEFADQLLAGPWGLQVASPFYPTVLTLGGVTTSLDPNATNLVVQFPPTGEVNGRLAGYVFAPDGSAAGPDVKVKISFGDDYVIRTDTNGFFDTQIALPARGYQVEATDPATGLRGIATAQVMPGITNLVNVQLLAKGELSVTVLRADGSPAAGAALSLEQGSYPGEHFQGVTDTNGTALFQNLFEGTYGVGAQFISGPTTLKGRAGARVFAGQASAVTLTLGATATIRGTFVTRDSFAPVTFAQVAVGDLGFTTSDTNGAFVVSGIPLGTYRLLAQNPVNGVGAILSVTLTYDGEVRDVQLVEQARGEIVGAVIDSYGTGFVSAASVTLTVGDGLTPARTVTTGPDGRFSFPATPAGAFQLDAMAPVTQWRGSRSGVLPEGAPTYEVNVPLESRATLAGLVYQPDGDTPATNASVQIASGTLLVRADADRFGRVAFTDLPLGTYTIQAGSLIPAENRSVGQTNRTLATAGAAPDFRVILRGVGSVAGRVLLSDGLTPAPYAQVTLAIQAPLAPGAETALADANGRYEFHNVAVGPYRLTAQAQALGATANGLITTNGQADSITLALGASGAVVGRLVRSVGTNAVSGIDVLLTFASQSGLPGRAFARTDSTGAFRFDRVPTGSFQLEAVAVEVGGIARLTASVVSNGETLDLGWVRLDEEDPFVTEVTPSASAVAVSVFAPIDLIFNEALDAASVQASGIYLRSGSQTVVATVQLLTTNGVARWVRIRPQARLLSQTTYDLVVLDGDKVDAFGALIGHGPRDRVGRSLLRPFTSRFTTADQDPPVLVSLSPSNNAVQIDPRAVLRLAFNEPVRDSNYTFTVTGPSGPVAGTASLGVNSVVLVFTPTAALNPNTHYSASVAGVSDLAGNLAVGQPFVFGFDTLDTVGPAITSLRLAENRTAIAGSAVPVEAVLATSESGGSVRFTEDFVAIGTVSAAPYRVNATLPVSGSVTFRAIATDRFGNDGPVSEFTVAVISNQPPAVFLARGVPPEGPVASGQAFTLWVSATDDVGVTNVIVIGLGGLAVSTNFYTGTSNRLACTLPADFVADTPMQFRAQATDALGARSAEATLDLPTVDATPPTLAILGPPDQSLLAPSTPLQLRVASLDNSSNYVLRLVLDGGFNATQTLQVATAPNTFATNVLAVSLAGAPTNGVSFTATLTASDSATNSTILIRTYLLPDSTPPTLSEFSPTNGETRVSVLTAIDATFSEPLDPNTISVTNFTLKDGAGLAVPGSLTVLDSRRQIRFQPASALAFGARYSIELGHGLSDLAGNPFAGLVSGFSTVSNLPPVLTLTRVDPTSGSVGSGHSLTVAFDATSELGIADLTVVASGAISLTNHFNDGSARTLSFNVPAETPSGLAVDFLAIARDPFGGQSQAAVHFAVFDATTPTIELLAPVAGTLIDPAQPLPVRVRSKDNSGEHTLHFEIAGAAASNQTVSVVSAPNLWATNGVTFSLAGVKPDGAALEIRLLGTDSATNRIQLNAEFRLLDATGPQWVAATPAAGATGQSLWLDRLLLQFSEPIAAGSISNRVSLSNDSGGTVLYSLNQGPSTVLGFAFEQLPLPAGATFTARVLPGLTDLASNVLTQTNGLPLGAEGLVSRFTTARILSVSPTNGATILSGQPLEVEVQFEAGLGADYFRFVLGDSAPVNVPLNAASTSARTSLPVPGYSTNLTNVTLVISALKSGAQDYQLPTVNLTPWRSQADTNGITVLGTNTLVLTAGQSTNLLLTFQSPDSPLVLVDYALTNPPPTFASLSELQFSNSVTNGSATVRLNLNPLQDAAGTYTIVVRAAARNGKAGVFQLALTVRDNPALLVTRWKEPADGYLDDVSRWTAGLPGSNVVGVIDLEGTYTITARGSISAAGLVLAATNSTCLISASLTVDAPIEIRAGTLAFSPNQNLALTLTRPMVNGGEIHLVSRYYTSTLNGPGFIENRGLIDSFVGVGGINDQEANLALPVSVTETGRWLLPTNAYVRMTAGSYLALAGVLEAQAGSRLRLENSGPPRDILLQGGARLLGEGTLRFDGDNRMLVVGEVTAPMNLQLNDSSGVVGTGLLHISGRHFISGNYLVDLEFNPDAEVNVLNSKFGGNVLIDSGALVTMDPNSYYTLTLDGSLINRGILRQVANYFTSAFTGKGRIVNEGLMDLAVGVGGYQGAEAIMQLPVHVAPSGTLRLNENGWLRVPNGGNLTVAGTLEIQTNARLRVVNDGPAQDLLLQRGAQLLGDGTLRMEGANRLILDDRLAVALHLEPVDSSTVSGSGVLRFLGNQTVFGNYAIPLEFPAGAVANVLNTHWGSSVLIEAGAVVAMNPNSAYTLTLDGSLTNRGILRQVANYYTSAFTGTGKIVNEGVMDFSVGVGGNNGAEASIALSIDVAATGRFELPAGGYARFVDGGWLRVAGTLEVQDGARLQFQNDGAARDLTLESGAQVIGSGTLRFYGSNRLIVNDRIAMPLQLQFFDSSTVSGSGVLRFLGNQTIFGNYAIPLEFPAGAVANVLNTHWGSSVLIEAGAVVAMNPNSAYTLTLDGSLTNRGILRQVANYYTSAFTGTGKIVNEGVMDFSVGVGGNNGAEASIALSIDVAATGRFELPAGGYARFVDGGWLRVAGTLEVQDGARLRFQNDGAARDLTLQAGAILDGAGTTQIEGANRLVLAGDATLRNGLLRLIDSSTVAGTGQLTVGSGATLLLDHNVTLPGALDVFGTLTLANSGVTLRVAGLLTLESGGTLNNPGTVRVSSFAGLGGIIVGNPPIIAPLAAVRMTSIRVDPASAGVGSSNITPLAGRKLNLTWTSNPGLHYSVERSSDFRNWVGTPAAIHELTPGHFEAVLTSAGGDHSYYRVRLETPAQTSP